ncbi:hypothetical protein YC2023_025209 [Brassica napus]
MNVGDKKEELELCMHYMPVTFTDADDFSAIDITLQHHHKESICTSSGISSSDSPASLV